MYVHILTHRITPAVFQGKTIQVKLPSSFPALFQNSLPFRFSSSVLLLTLLIRWDSLQNAGEETKDTYELRLQALQMEWDQDRF